MVEYSSKTASMVAYRHETEIEVDFRATLHAACFFAHHKKTFLLLYWSDPIRCKADLAVSAVAP